MNAETSQYNASIADAAQIGRHETNRQLVRKNGTRFQANIVLQPIFDLSKTIVGFGLIAHDIDRSRRIAAAVPHLCRQVPLAETAKIWWSTTIRVFSGSPWISRPVSGTA